MDTSLTLKLQKRVTELEQEKQSLRNELENKEEQFQRARARVRLTLRPPGGTGEAPPTRPHCSHALDLHGRLSAMKKGSESTAGWTLQARSVAFLGVASVNRVRGQG